MHVYKKDVDRWTFFWHALPVCRELFHGNATGI